VASGARAEHRDGRFQDDNKKAAFLKLVNSKEFKAWHKAECARRLGKEEVVKQTVEAWLDPKHIVVEYKTDSGWKRDEIGGVS
jgi:hypothetical protein